MSDVIGNQPRALKEGDGNLHHAISTRNEKNWQSNVFAGPEQDRQRRKNLEPQGQGKLGLYGDKDERHDW